MISSETLKTISHMFCGDIVGYYSYKTGPMLVRFFNENFGYKDTYSSGFPSRWAFVHDKMLELIKRGRIDEFFSIILSKNFIVKDMSLSEVNAIAHSDQVFQELNRLLRIDQYLLINSSGNVSLTAIENDLEYIGGGGFANVYKQKSTGLVVKKLKDDFLSDDGIRSRFKREFNITQSLKDLYGIINVFSFSEDTFSYTMEKAECTLEEYLERPDITDEIKLNCIRQILYIMSKVHDRDVIHRDLSPTNIFVIQGKLVLADFGLGKDLNMLTSHRTVHTNAFGQFFYCAPEQFMLLREGDKRSDVFSLGRLINFIMTKDPQSSHHLYRTVAEKAASDNPSFRHADAGQLSTSFEKLIEIQARKDRVADLLQKIEAGRYDESIEAYFYEQSSEKICTHLLEETPGIIPALLWFMSIDDKHAEHIIQCVENSFREVCYGSFPAHDIFATFSYDILRGAYSFVVKELAAMILRYIAVDVNRYSAQRLVDNLKKEGVEPLIEELLE